MRKPKTALQKSMDDLNRLDELSTYHSNLKKYHKILIDYHKALIKKHEEMARRWPGSTTPSTAVPPPTIPRGWKLED